MVSSHSFLWESCRSHNHWQDLRPRRIWSRRVSNPFRRWVFRPLSLKSWRLYYPAILDQIPHNPVQLVVRCSRVWDPLGIRLRRVSHLRIWISPRISNHNWKKIWIWLRRRIIINSWESLNCSVDGGVSRGKKLRTGLWPPPPRPGRDKSQRNLSLETV